MPKTPLPQVTWRPLLDRDGNRHPPAPSNADLLTVFEEAAIAYREYMCSETGKEYDAAKEAVLERMPDVFE